jgi:LemA protein
MNTDALYIAGGIAFLLLLWVIVSYNRFVNQKNLVRNSWSNVDTELRRRYDLIPNLVETVKGYAAHERAVLEEVTVARTNAVRDEGSAGEQSRTESELVGALRRLWAVVENYPDLRASSHFLQLQDELTNTEDRIQAARRFFNANVADYNRRVQSFPSVVIAKVFGFGLEEYFQVEPALVAAVDRGPRASF